MNGTVRDDQIRFAVTRDERLAWQAGLQKRSLNGSALLREFMNTHLDNWRIGETQEDAETAA